MMVYLKSILDVIGVRDDGTIIYKNEVILMESAVGSVGDIYIEGKGFFRFAGI